MEGCSSDSHAFGAGYERAKGYSRVGFYAPEVPKINEVKSTKEPGPCFKYGGPHFQRRCTKKKSYPNDKSQNDKKINNSHTFWQNYHNNGQFPTGTISFHV